MTGQTTERNYLWLYFVLAYAISWALWIPSALLANGVTFPKWLADYLTGPFNIAAFGPFVAAFVLTFLEGGWKGVGRLLKSGVSLGSRKTWLLPAFFLLPLLFGGGILLSIWLGATALDLSVLSNPPYATIAFFVILFTGGPIQEEFGWRGYALPRLQARYNALQSSLILGGLWWLWHLPLVFFPGRFMTDNFGLFLLLSVVITLTTILFTWVYNLSGGSVLATLLMHTGMNWGIWVLIPGMIVNLTIIAIWIALLALAVFLVIRKWGAERLGV